MTLRMGPGHATGLQRDDTNDRAPAGWVIRRRHSLRLDLVRLQSPTGGREWWLGMAAAGSVWADCSISTTGRPHERSAD